MKILICNARRSFTVIDFYSLKHLLRLLPTKLKLNRIVNHVFDYLAILPKISYFGSVNQTFHIRQCPSRTRLILPSPLIDFSTICYHGRQDLCTGTWSKHHVNILSKNSTGSAVELLLRLCEIIFHESW